MRDLNLLRELTQLWGVAGYEKPVRQYIGKIVAPYADEMITDAVGNLIVLKKGIGGPKAKKIMLAAHMDEIGFMVKKIEPDGRLRVCQYGMELDRFCIQCKSSFPQWRERRDGLPRTDRGSEK